MENKKYIVALPTAYSPSERLHSLRLQSVAEVTRSQAVLTDVWSGVDQIASSNVES